MINSIETERLERLINRKKQQLQKLKSESPDNKAILYLNSEITFLEDSIMPILLADTTVDYMEIRNFITRSMRELERYKVVARKATELVLHFHLKDQAPGDDPLAVCFSNIGMSRQFVTDLYVDNHEAMILPL